MKETVRKDSDLVRQVREAFNTVILNDRFLSDEEWQLSLLQDLKRHLSETGEQVDEAMHRGTGIIAELRESLEEEHRH